ncbi:uncharacterized protein SOCEGT47_074710 [Sorangium cellulosum]|uniref:VOC domain-containing protein n=1 Tax=Sorangium cellulosum TaxID=56 RepID=A0A4P2QC17_SORCE|nr:VOC family protein [Sorangium cellulosum]AUX26901.1 uncharacterized protein SOCEGT47_074710 [Sorangium cellulosum]
MAAITPQKLTPILFVEDIESALSFWTETLGFQIVVNIRHEDKIGFVIMVLNGVEVMLQSRASLQADVPAVVPERFSPAAALYIDVPDVRPVAEHLQKQKAEILVPLRTTFYGSQEIWVRAPGGHVIAFAQPKAD